MNIAAPGFKTYMKKLGQAAGIEILDFSGLKRALIKRMDFFQQMGCRESDHSLDYAMYIPASEKEVESIFAKAMADTPISYEEELKYKTAFLIFAGKEYKRRNWVMQLHYGVKRDNNRKIYRMAGGCRD